MGYKEIKRQARLDILNNIDSSYAKIYDFYNTIKERGEFSTVFKRNSYYGIEYEYKEYKVFNKLIFKFKYGKGNVITDLTIGNYLLQKSFVIFGNKGHDFYTYFKEFLKIEMGIENYKYFEEEK